MFDPVSPMSLFIYHYYLFLSFVTLYGGGGGDARAQDAHCLRRNERIIIIYLYLRRFGGGALKDRGGKVG